MLGDGHPFANCFGAYRGTRVWIYGHLSVLFAQRKDGRSECGPVAGEQHEWHDPTRTRVCWSQGDSEHGVNMDEHG